MRIHQILTGVMVCLWCSIASAQPGDPFADDEEAIRAQIQALEKKLANRRKPERSSDRVTEIGGSGLRSWQSATQEPLVVRIYDLSDLFAVAPAYYARQSADLDGDQLIFDRAQGVMGGGMGGMGGFFAIRPASIPSKTPEPLRQIGNNHEGDSAGNLGAARTSLDDLLKSITQTISPEEWKENGARHNRPARQQPDDLDDRAVARADREPVFALS
jgi:hypothetical protein